MRAILRHMRALVLLGVLATAACGLDMGGLAADPAPDAPPDATSIEEGATGSEDASAGDSIPILTGNDGGALSPRPALEGGGDEAIAPSDDGGADGSPEADDAGLTGEVSPDAVAIEVDGGADATGVEAGVDAASDAPSAADGSTLCSNGVPSGWKVALYTVGTDPCPSSFIAHDVYAEPTVGPTACSCDCTVTQEGDCMQGSMTVSGNPDNGPSCGTPLFSMDVSGSACLTVPDNSPPVSLPTRMQASPLPPQGAACSGTSRVDTTQVSMASARYCDVPTSSTNSVCSGAVPSSFDLCIATDGMIDCPLGTPFVHRSVVEDGVMLKCSPCTACAATTSCSNATITAYDNRACRNSPIVSLSVDGACDLSMGSMGMGGGGFPVEALGVKYSATATTTCAAGSSTGGTQLSNPRTICCP